MKILSILITTLIFCCNSVWAQGASFSLTGGTHDATLPVEVTADSLSVDQNSNSAEFSGNARIGQGKLRLGADSIIVNYDTDSSQIASVKAQGSVVFTNGADSAESSKAEYNITSGVLEMIGNVLLLQGKNAFTGDMLTINAIQNTARLTGNVKTVLVPK